MSFSSIRTLTTIPKQYNTLNSLSRKQCQQPMLEVKRVKYNKIPKISHRANIFQRLIFGGAYLPSETLRFKIDWASPIFGSKFTVFALFYFVFEGNFPSTSPQGAYIWRGDLRCFDVVFQRPYRYFSIALRCFDTVFQRRYRHFSIALKVVFFLVRTLYNFHQ